MQPHLIRLAAAPFTSFHLAKCGWVPFAMCNTWKRSRTTCRLGQGRSHVSKIWVSILLCLLSFLRLPPLFSVSRKPTPWSQLEGSGERKALLPNGFGAFWGEKRPENKCTVQKQHKRHCSVNRSLYLTLIRETWVGPYLYPWSCCYFSAHTANIYSNLHTNARHYF